MVEIEQMSDEELSTFEMQLDLRVRLLEAQKKVERDSKAMLFRVRELQKKLGEAPPKEPQ